MTQRKIFVFSLFIFTAGFVLECTEVTEQSSWLLDAKAESIFGEALKKYPLVFQLSISKRNELKLFAGNKKMVSNVVWSVFV